MCIVYLRYNIQYIFIGKKEVFVFLRIVRYQQKCGIHKKNERIIIQHMYTIYYCYYCYGMRYIYASLQYNGHDGTSYGIVIAFSVI